MTTTVAIETRVETDMVRAACSHLILGADSLELARFLLAQTSRRESKHLWIYIHGVHRMVHKLKGKRQ